MKKGFTLAEVMITLTVIGIITAVIIPVANNSKPNENVMKFKKAHNVLYQVMTGLVASDYYYEGDLGRYPDGRYIENNDGDIPYFCKTFAEFLSTKSEKCSDSDRDDFTSSVIVEENEGVQDFYDFSIRKGTQKAYEVTKKRLDNTCKTYATVAGKEIITPDNVVYYRTKPQITFGLNDPVYNCRHISFKGDKFRGIVDETGFPCTYIVFCIDIDGFNEKTGSANCDDIKDICPFGYGIRADGKILTGKRADTWLEKGNLND